MSAAPPDFRIDVFGGLRIQRDGHDLDLGPIRRQTLLAALVAARGRVVGMNDLVDLLWGDEPPRSATNQVHRLVGEARRALEPGLGSRAPGQYVAGSPAGYRLITDEVATDLSEVEAQLTEGQRATLAHDTERAAECFAKALEITREPAFESLPPSALSRPEFGAVEELRVSAALRAADAHLRTGHPQAVLDGVSAVARTQPLHEPLQAALIRLLGAADRRRDASAVYKGAVAALRTAFDTGPGVELDAAMDAVHGRAPGDRQADSKRRRSFGVHLPPPIASFIERPEVSAALDAVVRGAGQRAIPPIAITGLAGIGKTAFAAAWARENEARFPDGLLYVDLQGFSGSATQLDLLDAITLLSSQLGLAAAPGEPTADELLGRFRAALIDRRIVLLLDNAHDEQQIRHLITVAPGCVTLITSRNRLPGLLVREGARLVDVSPLSRVQSRLFLRRRLGHLSRSWDDRAAADIVDACGGLPLALALAAAQVLLDPGLSMAKVAERISDEHRRLGQLDVDVEDDGLQSAFSSSYGSLSPDAAFALRALSSYPGSAIRLPELSSVIGQSLEDAEASCRELAAASFLRPSADGGWVVHDLLRLYSAVALRASGEEDDTRMRLIAHFAVACENAYGVTGVDVYARQQLPVAPMFRRTFADQSEVTGWYEHERVALWRVFDLCIECGFDRIAALMELDLRVVMQEREPGSELLARAEQALDAALRVDDPALIAELEREVAGRHVRAGNFARAQLHYGRASDGFQVMGDLVGAARVARSRATLAQRMGDREGELRFAVDAVRIARATGDDRSVAQALAFQANALTSNSEWSDAFTVSEEARLIAGRTGLAYLVPYLLSYSATASVHLDRARQAVELAEAGLEALLGDDEVFLAYEFRVTLGWARHLLRDDRIAEEIVADYLRLRAETAPELVADWGSDLIDLDDRVEALRTMLDARR